MNEKKMDLDLFEKDLLDLRIMINDFIIAKKVRKGEEKLFAADILRSMWEILSKYKGNLVKKEE